MVEAAIQAGEEDHLEAIPAVEASHRPGLQEEAAAAGPLVEEDGHQEAAEAALQAEEDGLRAVVEDHLVEADGHHLGAGRREAAADLQEEEVAGRQAEAAGVPREAVREDSLRPSPHQAAQPAPGA